MTEAHKWRRLYTPPADLQGQIRDSPTANSFFFFFPQFPELSGMLYGLVLSLTCLKAMKEKIM